jgi:hypothetical protein
VKNHALGTLLRAEAVARPSEDVSHHRGSDLIVDLGLIKISGKITIGNRAGS